jgi:phthalate 4,5-cis-dihydrodiol dehydrogenase
VLRPDDIHENDVMKNTPIRLGVAGLGIAGAFMIRAAAQHPGFSLCAAADPLPRPREAFAQQFGGKAYADYGDLCRDPSVEAIYIASPHRFHASQAIEAMEHGKHVLCEKPLALSLADCDAVIAAADRTGVQVIVGHTHAFDPNIGTMRRIVQSGELGRLGMVLTFNYNNFLFRPHRADEFDSEFGGGAVFNQVAHQIEIVRMIGDRVRSVRANIGALDRARPAAGHCMTFLEFESGAAATLVFSGYDFFDSDEWHHWVSEGGVKKEADRHGKTREAFLTLTNEREAHQKLGFGSRALSTDQPHLPHFGLIVATCELGDLRLSPDGLVLHGAQGTREIAVERGPAIPGHGDTLDALWAALREARPSLHTARWSRHTIEVILAILRSAKEGREISLT